MIFFCHDVLSSVYEGLFFLHLLLLPSRSCWFFLPIVLWECEKLGLEKLKKLLLLMQINTHWFYCIDKLLVWSLKACGLSRTELLTHSIE